MPRRITNSEDLHNVFADILFGTEEVQLICKKNPVNQNSKDKTFHEIMEVLDDIAPLIKDADYIKLCNLLMKLKKH
jgi:hypothetical protein